MKPEHDAHYLEKRKTRLGFERAADTYDASAVLQREIGNRLLERLAYVKMQPQRVLDVGCGTGVLTEQLLQHYKKATVLGVDLAESMVRRTAQRGGWFRKPKTLCADASALPFAAASMDMLVSNLMLQWCNDLPQVFTEWGRVLRPDGLVMFATFGPDTLKELRAAWQQVDGQPHVSQFVDMHDVGDALLQAGFRDPVMDMERITLTYDAVPDLLRDLKAIGANNATVGRARGLTGKARMQEFYQEYEQFKQDDGQYPASYEVVYGHAWAPVVAPSTQPEHYIPIKAV